MLLPFLSFAIGFLFSLGLGLSGMTDPNKVFGFLDITRAWDPTLIFVMGSAIPVYFVFWQIYKRRGKPICDKSSHLPTIKKVDRKLIIGAAIFGVGWGMAGICPGPAIAGLGVLATAAIVFVVGFSIGGRLESVVDHKFD